MAPAGLDGSWEGVARDDLEGDNVIRYVYLQVGWAMASFWWIGGSASLGVDNFSREH